MEAGFEEETFYDYTTKQRRYCGFRNEWDLYVGFAPGERGLGIHNLNWDDADILEFDKDYYPPPPQVTPSTHPLPKDTVLEVSSPKLRQFDSKNFALNFLRTMYLRFGFVLPPGYVHYPSNPCILDLLGDFKRVARAVSFHESCADSLDLDARKHIANFVQSMIDGTADKPSLPPVVLWDLSSECPNPMLNLKSSVAVERRCFCDSQGSQRIFYQLSIPSSPLPFPLFVERADVALECKCVSSATKHELVEYIFMNSCHFVTRCSESALVPPKNKYEGFKLGERQDSYRPDSNDFNAYVKKLR